MDKSIPSNILSGTSSFPLTGRLYKKDKTAMQQLLMLSSHFHFWGQTLGLLRHDVVFDVIITSSNSGADLKFLFKKGRGRFTHMIFWHLKTHLLPIVMQ